MLKSCIIPILFVFLVSCSGYRLKRGENSLFYNEGIRSLAIPMFINQTMYPHVAGALTIETSKVLASVSGLTIFSGESDNADAILVGVVSSPLREAESIRTDAIKATEGTLDGSLGNRSGFFVPTSSRYKISVRYFLIKSPSSYELELLKSKVAGRLEQNLMVNPKVVFNQTFNYEGSFNREIATNDGPDSGGVVNYTKTKKFFEQSLNSIAKGAARDLRELILNVF
jgi:hypothetical protein